MEGQIREARVTLGNKTYLLRTALGADEFSRLLDFSQNLFNSLDSTSDQERRLLLGWMHMAYKLLQIKDQLHLLLDSTETSTPEDSR